MTPPAKLRRIIAFRLTTAEPAALADFYTEGIGFSAGAPSPILPAEMACLGLTGGGARLNLTLGEQQFGLDRFEEVGRPYPEGATAADLCFQHFAIVVTDIGLAYERALAHGAAPISARGPVQLPAASGGVIAVKFRDPEGHPLEFLQFPKVAPPKWANRAHASGPLGIDHSAVSVADATISSRFYENCGLRTGRITFNHGDAQAALDGLAAPEADVVPLQPENRTPHLELLGYHQPRGKPAQPTSPADIAATRIVWASDQDSLLRDPDGHFHLLRAQA